MAYLDDDQDPTKPPEGGVSTPAPVGPPAPTEDPDVAKFRQMLDILNASKKAVPPPQMPDHADPAVARASQERLGTLAGIQGLVGLRTVTPYDVKQGLRPSVQSSPGYEAAKSAAMLPVQQEQARVAASGHSADIYNKWLEAQAGRDTKSGIADVGVLKSFITSQAGVKGKEIGANAAIETGAAHDKAKLDAEKIKMGGAGAGLTPEARRQNAIRYLKTAQMPSFGMGAAGAAARKQLLNDAAALDSGADIAANASDYKADTGSLTNLTKNTDQMKMFEGTARPNLMVLRDAAKKIGDSGSPWLNKPLRSWDQNALGSTEMAAFNAARQIVTPEVARVLQTAGGNGVLSDTARKEVDTVLDPNATIDQISAAADVILKDFANRSASANASVAGIKNRIRGNQQGGAGPVRSFKRINGKLTEVDANGNPVGP